MTGAAPLALSDLVVHVDGPRVRDLRLAEVLGFERPRKIREIIERNRAEISAYGALISDVATTHSGTRPTAGRVFCLNEAQALIACMFARTERAAEVRRQIITVFLAWRRGELTLTSAPALPPPDPFALARERIDLVTAQIALQRDVPDPLMLAVANAPVWSNGRRPNFWADLPVRALLTGAHRQMPIKTALELCRRQFGDTRTPSKSAVARYWMVLDRVRGGRA